MLYGYLPPQVFLTLQKDHKVAISLTLELESERSVEVEREEEEPHRRGYLFHRKNRKGP